jgi:3-deoxy-D-manno-octulosonic-acid transferase
LRILYDIVTTLLAPFAAVGLLVHRKHRPLLGRFFPSIPVISERPIWVQACSLGEVNAARPIIAAMRKRWPEIPVLLTTSTRAGRAAATASPNDFGVAWCPFDHFLSVRGFLRRVKPRALLLVETELWPNLVGQSRRAGVPVLIVNGRLSDRHYPRYQRFAFALRSVFKQVSLAGVQNEEYAARFVEFGLEAAQVRVTGITKFDGVQDSVAVEVQDQIRAESGIEPGAPVLLFGSTRPGDEALAADCWRSLLSDFPSLRLVVVPRHLKRIDEVLASLDGPVLRRSEVLQGHVPTGGRPILVVDTMGELTAFYSIATVAVVGGSFFPGVNGHNPLEPAALGVPTVFGPFMRNFMDHAHILATNGGAVQVSSEDLAAALADLLHDSARRQVLGARGRELVFANRGAIGRNLDLLEEMLH